MSINITGLGTLLVGVAPAASIWDVTDANANALHLSLPAGGSVNVPVVAIGVGIIGVDLGFFNGITQPEFAVVDADRDSYISLGHSADDVASIYTLTATGSRTESIKFTETQMTFAGADVVVADGNGFLLGNATQLTTGNSFDTAVIPEFQLAGTAGADTNFGLFRASADANMAQISFTKSRNAALGSFTILQTGDIVGKITFNGDDGVDYITTVCAFEAQIDTGHANIPAPAANTLPGRAILKLAQGASLVEMTRWNSLGNLIHGGQSVAAHGSMDIGVLINQGGHDGLSFVLQSTDVAHGLGTAATQVTGAPDTADYFGIEKFAGATGGAKLTAYGENAAVTTNYRIQSFGGQPDTTKSTAGRSLVEVYVSQHDGANALSNITADGNVFGVLARRGAADVAVLLLDEDGDAWFGGAVTVSADHAGLANTVTFTNQVNNDANSTGAGSIKLKGATGRDSSGFLKIMDGTTARYIPYFDTITG